MTCAIAQHSGVQAVSEMLKYERAVLPLVGGSPYGKGIWPFVGSRENLRGKLQNVDGM